jgi:hypothetical protein
MPSLERLNSSPLTTPTPPPPPFPWVCADTTLCAQTPMDNRRYTLHATQRYATRCLHASRYTLHTATQRCGTRYTLHNATCYTLLSRYHHAIAHITLSRHHAISTRITPARQYRLYQPQSQNLMESFRSKALKAKFL